jgi:hypothetical protein
MNTKTQSPKAPKRKRGGQPGNRNAWRHGFYSDKFTPDEMSRARGCAERVSLDDEIWMLRILNRRLFDLIGPATDGAQRELAVEQLVAIAHALSASTGRVTRLLYARQALDGAPDDLATAIN